MKTSTFSTCAVLAAAVFNGVSAIDLDVNSRDSIKSASSEIAAGLISYYDPDEPNLLPEPYAWWHAGAMFSTLVDYWALTGDASYLSTTQNALLSQVGPNKNYVPDSQIGSLANNEQGIWALAAMAAAEHGFPFPDQGDDDDAQDTCDGGLRWQISPSNKGYDYKNVESNGAFFQLAARFAAYHSDGDGPYAEWAHKVFYWLYEVDYIHNSGSMKDGGHTPDCDDSVVNEFVYEFWGINSGLLIEGAVNMYNVTKDHRRWGGNFYGLVDRATEVFFYKDTNIMWERLCEGSQPCYVNPRMYKRFLARALSKTTIFAPFTKETLMPLLTASAEGAAMQCSSGGGTNKTTKCEL
ncbi:hydrolase family 76 protein [Aspergillus sp. HF37]|nr:hydrolase family 76 protein [Aspergillus sp. HF37]